MSNTTPGSEWHWDGQKWLWWNGSAWVETGSAPAAPPADAGATAVPYTQPGAPPPPVAPPPPPPAYVGPAGAMPPPQRSGMSTGAVVGIAIGAVALVAIIGFFMLIVLAAGSSSDTTASGSRATSPAQPSSQATASGGATSSAGANLSSQQTQAIYLAKDAWTRCNAEAAAGTGIDMSTYDDIINDATWAAEPTGGGGTYRVYVTTSPGTHDFLVNVPNGTVQPTGTATSAVAAAVRSAGKCTTIYQ